MFKFEDYTQLPQQWAKMTSDFFAKIPKSESEIKDTFVKLQAVFKDEAASSQTVWKTYQAAAKGEVSPKDVLAANTKIQELMKTARFAFLLTTPGSFFLPVLIKTATEYGVDLVPQSVKTQFDI